MRGTHNVATYALPILAATSFIVASLTQAVFARAPSPYLWRGYHTLTVAEGIPLEEVVSRLERRIPSSRIVSRITSTVSVTTFGGREEVGVAELERRLDPRDPRLDDYMRRLDAMFHGSVDGRAAHVLYLRSSVALPVYSLLVSRLLAGLEGEWSLAGLSPAASLLTFAAALLYLALVTWSGRSAGSTLFTVSASLPWLVGCALGSLTDLLSFFLVFPFCLTLLLALRSIWPAGGWPSFAELASSRTVAGLASLGVALAANAALVLAQGHAALEVFRGVTAAAADALLLATVLLWKRSVRRRAAHAVFVPVVIGRSIHRLVRRSPSGFRDFLESTRGILRARPAELALVLAVVCLAPLVALVGEASLAASVPAPVPSGLSPIRWDTLERLWLLGRSDELPSVADFVAHEAYQSSLSYGGGYRLPSRQETLNVRSFAPRADGPGLEAGERTVTRYDGRWLRTSLARARPGSVDALLVSQRRATRIGIASEAPGAEFWKIFLRFAMVAVFLVMGSRYLGPSVLFGSSRPELARRRPEVA